MAQQHYALAVRLRKKGLTYSEIATQAPVSKATLSLWLKDVPVPRSYAKRLQRKRLKAVSMGWAARRAERIRRTELIATEARGEVKKFMNDPLWLVGLALYWAEGHKEKAWGKGTLVTFTNMDVETLLIFRKWCMAFAGIARDDFVYSLYLHDTHRKQTKRLCVWWARILDVSPGSISVYYKHSKTKHVRHNDGVAYRGVFRINVRRSIDFNRRISVWISAVIDLLKNAR